MKILIVGAGGREHAIAWKISQNEKVNKIFAAPGNAYNKVIKNCENINISATDDILKFAEQEKIDLTIVGSEELLVDGIVDKFHEKGLKIFGPDKKVAMLEGSKAFAKDFMQKYGVKTAKYKSFTEKEKAIKYLEEMSYPVVIKASGLAAGKGVIICQNEKEALEALDEIMTNKIFASAGDTVVIEEFLDGVEVSILSITDSKVILPFLSAKDHKKISEGEQGLNTGGMGVISPNPYYTKEVEEKFVRDILEPTLKGIKEEKFDFCGIIFFGLMIARGEVYLLEYNMRMGDPETQAVLPLLESDYLELIEAAIDRKLENFDIKWKNSASCCVVLAAGGYPVKYEKGNIISGLEKFENNRDAKVFFAGVKESGNNFTTNGGRVLNVVSVQNSAEKAREIAYKELEKIQFKDKYFRKDIGLIK
ncbi:phosphoribosylamine--glycine ligase [Fusobacterium gastrosuis]|uniref:phosphoribosylamine--glycine ligase n=1 Tax=Fusobacterium gastrosuis TaxID=1755100 RepID=UPI001F4F12AA|nr:phosphoribosylamine--glycine ligase [Fusobacterium gastrosuis]MDD7411442.1 phosphoribosylamine--glycine ligase [Fusobacteriaceae bacterium]MDY5713796.1 phosphoribosylamine--glycine ligase [Fusobacterium gastrosuis]